MVLQHDVFGVGVTPRSHDLRQYGDRPELRQVWWQLFILVWRGRFVFRKTDQFISDTYVIHLSDMFAGSVPAFYREVYNIVCPNAEDHVDHDMFVNLLVKSSLPKHTLTQVNQSVLFDYIKLPLCTVLLAQQLVLSPIFNFSNDSIYGTSRMAINRVFVWITGCVN